MSRITFVCGTAAILIVGASIGWITHREFGKFEAHAGAEAKEGAGKDPHETRVQVVTVPLERGSLAIVAAVVGRVEADPSAVRTISGLAGGLVLETLASKGQLVRAGEGLVRFDPRPLNLVLLQQKSLHAAAANQLSEFELVGSARTERELQAAEQKSAAELAMAETALLRLVPLKADGLVAEKSISDARYACEKARLDHANAEGALRAWSDRGRALQLATLQASQAATLAAVHEAERANADAEVRAPRDGRLLSWSVRSGDRCDPFAALGVLLCGDQRVVVFGATPSVAQHIGVGARATWIDESGAAREGRVGHVAGQVASDGLVDVIVKVGTADSPSMPGTIVRGEIEVGQTPESTLVPLEALLRQGRDLQVLLADPEGKARRALATVLARSQRQAAITCEVRTATRVVTSGGYNVPDGAVLVEVEPVGESKR